MPPTPAEPISAAQAQPSAKPDLHYEDFLVGSVLAFGHKLVTEADIVRYARAFDPQPFHLSEEAAKDSNVGRLIASGYHTCVIMMRLASDGLLCGAASLGSPGLDEVRFLKPVFPGDELTGRCQVLAKRELKSRPGVGVLHCMLELENNRGETVITWNVKIFRRLRGMGAPS